MKKLFVLIIILLIFPYSVKATKQEDIGKRIAGVAYSAATTYKSDFTYTYFWAGTTSKPVSKKSVTNDYLRKGFLGIKSSGYTYGFKNKPGIQGSFKNKFATYCETWALLIPYHAKGGGSTSNAYKTIPLNTSNLRPGDKVRYKYPDAHIAIYVDDNNDSNPDTYRIAEAAGYNGGIRVAVAYFSGKSGDSGKVTEMQRIDEEVANKISYNIIDASTDFHNSLDHFAPIIDSVTVRDNFGNIAINATDNKQYNGTVKSIEVEPASNGIVGYLVTTTSAEPTSDWIKVSAQDLFYVQTKVTSNGEYYAWVLDVGGNVASKSFTVSNYVEPKSNEPSSNNNGNSSNNGGNGNSTNNNSNNNNSDNSSNGSSINTNSGGCNPNLQKIINVVKSVYNIILIIVPIILLVISTVDLTKAVMAGDEKDIKNSTSILTKRLMLAAVVFIFGHVVSLILSLVPNSGGWLACW